MFAKRKAQKQRKAELASVNRQLHEVRISLNDAWSIFNNTTDPALTEACIYEINALRARYDHVIKGARTYFF